MEIPSLFKGESIVRLLQGTAFGAVAAMIVGFNWGGWTLATTSAKFADNQTKTAIVSALAPICVDKFQTSENSIANLAELKDKSSYSRTAFIEKGGWAVLPGSEEPSKGVAKACAQLLTEV